VTDKPTLSPESRGAFMVCFATRGKNKGLLLSKAPSPMTGLPYAAWQGAMMACNPFKVSIMGAFFMSEEQQKVKDEVTAYLDARPALAKVLDKDRSSFEKLWVW
jgi:hypothetical protein